LPDETQESVWQELRRMARPEPQTIILEGEQQRALGTDIVTAEQLLLGIGYFKALRFSEMTALDDLDC
jgi:hypothetical protein